MALNYDGRLEIKFRVLVSPSGFTPMIHSHTVDFEPQEISEVEPGALFSNIVTRWHDGTVSSDLETDVLQYVDHIKNFWAAGESSIAMAELWKYPAEPSTNPSLISVLEIGEAGANGSGTQVAGQWTMSFTTAGGNPMRVQLMEFGGANMTTYQLPPLTPASAALAFSQYMTSLLHPWMGRDNTRPLATRSLATTQNEKLYNTRYR